MTWYADEIMICGTPKALAFVTQHPHFSACAYHVKSIAGHTWYREEHRHTLPAEGLLVIRPIRSGNEEAHALGWYEETALDWNVVSGGGALPDPTVSQLLREHLGEDCPPTTFRQALRSMALELGQPVLYYSCAMWGGDIEQQYCLMYTPADGAEAAAIYRNPDGEGSMADALVAGLAHLGIAASTGYFALHERGFDWQRHRLV
jgi:hypothetical protein